jgi:inorganic triphosphatase YgiF
MLARAQPKAAPELELKFQLGAGAMEALQAELFPPSRATTAQLHAVYFDTPDYALRDGGFSLRVRRSGGTHIQTLKHRADGGLFERDEWEMHVAGPDLELQHLAETPVAPVIADKTLSPVFTVEVERRSQIWAWGETRVEVSFDTGLVVGGGRREPIAEMELELLSGSSQVLFALARELSSKADLTLMFESKAQRGYRLVGHDGVAALRAQNSAVGPQTPCAEAFRLIARDALVQIAGNARLLRRANNPDVLHQARVGLRRMRAALSVFKGMLDPEGLNVARTETRWLAGELAEARDIDVFLQRSQTHDDIEDDPGRASFFRVLRVAQAEAYERGLAAVRSARFRALLLSLAEWIEVGVWLQQANDGERTLREVPATAFAAPIMSRLDRRVRKGARRFRSIDAAARHDLRKQAKKLRYAAAFFAEAFPEHPKRRLRFMAALKALQDQLGELNDIVVAQAVALRAVGGRSGEVAFAAGLEVGRLSKDEGELVETTAAALKAFRKVKTFWSPEHTRGEDLNVSRSRLRSA